MRRLLIITTTLLAAGSALVALSWGSRAQGSSTARFNVIFDDARGLIGGQLVKVAGAKAGVIEDVTVTPSFKARVEASIDSRFMPFHQDATCTIRPEGLIAENYVDCDPGTLGSPPLKASGGQPPTVAVNHTTEPVSLLDLFNIFNLPTRQRFTAIVNELGIGTAGRGDDLNAILRRANPTLALARQVISILDRQRVQLTSSIDSTGAIATEAAAHTGTLQRFLDRAANLTSLTAAHRDNLSQAIKRLPPLLAAAQPSLAALDTVARDGTPLVAQLHAAVPSLSRVQRDLGPFAATAAPATTKVRAALRSAIPAIRGATPLLRTLTAYVARSQPGTKLFGRLASNLQQHGFVENFLGLFYYVGAALARFDGTSHMLGILLVGPQNGLCGAYATTPVAGCSAHFGAQPAYTSTARASSSGRGLRRAGTAPSAPRQAGGSATPAPVTASPPASPPGGSAAPAPGSSKPGGAVQQSAGTLENLVNYLLR
ncbi:MAG: MlaD family protein [Solirubrobacteraceae bacterium]